MNILRGTTSGITLDKQQTTSRYILFSLAGFSLRLEYTWKTK